MSEMKRVEEAKEEALWWSEWAQAQGFYGFDYSFHYTDPVETVFFWG